MNFSFKNIIVIFLVGLLGGIVGTFGILEINKTTGNKVIEQDSSIVINKVEYPTIEKSNYTIAIDKAYDTVVEITSTVQTQSFFGMAESYSLGSGVIISEDGYIVTNNHVVEGAKAVSIKMHDNNIYDAKIIGTDAKTDLAVVKIEAKGLEFASLVDSSQLVLGQECIAIGNPLGEGISCSNGIISSLNKEITINGVSMSVIQTNAAINQGNSGGGLFNMNGDLIAVVNAKSSGSLTTASVEGMGYAIPANTVQKIVKDLVDYGYVKTRATLGVSIYSSTAYSDGTISGVIVAEVVSGGAADLAGIQQFDIITSINGKETSSYSQLSKILESYNVGDEVEIQIYRGYADSLKARSDVANLTELKVKAKLQEAVQEIQIKDE